MILFIHLIGAYAGEMIWSGAQMLETQPRVTDGHQIISPPSHRQRDHSRQKCCGIPLSLGMAEIQGNWGTFEKGYCFCDPCVDSSGLDFSPKAVSGDGNFPGEGGIEDWQRVFLPALRRLVLRRRSASSRRGGRKNGGLCWCYWTFFHFCPLLITRRS